MRRHGHNRTEHVSICFITQGMSSMALQLSSKHIFVVVFVVFVIECVIRSHCHANADILSEWNFNQTNNGEAISNPNADSGPGFGSLLGGVSGTSQLGVTKGATPAGQSWSTSGYPTQGTGDKSAGVVFFVSTAGFDLESISYDHYYSMESADTVYLQFTIDGGSTWQTRWNFVPIAPQFEPTWISHEISFSVPFTDLQVDNNPNFGFRIVASFNELFGGNGTYRAFGSISTYDPNANWKFDNIRLNGVRTIPEPRPFLVSAIFAVAIWVQNRRVKLFHIAG